MDDRPTRVDFLDLSHWGRTVMKDPEALDISAEWLRLQRERAQEILHLTEPDRRFLAALKIGL